MKTGNLVTDSKNMSNGTFLTESDLGFLHNEINLIGGGIVEQMELLTNGGNFEISGLCTILNSDDKTNTVTFTTNEPTYGWGLIYSNSFQPETNSSVNISWTYRRVLADRDVNIDVQSRSIVLFHFFRLFTTG